MFLAPWLWLACTGEVPPEAAQAPVSTLPAPPAPAAYELTELSRVEFNRAALLNGEPLFWADDTIHPGNLEPSELDVYWGPWSMDRSALFSPDGKPTEAFLTRYQVLVRIARSATTVRSIDTTDQKRRNAVIAELDRTRMTAIRSDFSASSPEEKAFIQHMMDAASRIETLYGLQKGTVDLEASLPLDDPPSRMLFWRYQGPWCETAGGQADAECMAISPKPARISGLYPIAIQSEKGFCETLEAKQPELFDPFTAVVEHDGIFTTEPYPTRWPNETAAVADALRQASAALTDPNESALREYLTAAASAFETNDWFSADAAWAKMNATNSKWYVRVGPDETYYEPCNRKAGFHLTFARINTGALERQKDLQEQKQAMEDAVAKLAGQPYAARQVAFQLPDFVDIVLNAGDARSGFGATIGQSLPNWGPVAESGGRTIAMTNLNNDPDSIADRRKQQESMFCAATMRYVTADPEPELFTTVLHEATHNLGPASGYRVDGKTDEEAFGGPLAAVMEELKAQTGALYFTDWLKDKNVIDEKMQRQAHIADISWAFGKMAAGMTESDGSYSTYPQLSAIQFGYLLDQQAIIWRPSQPAANGSDRGCYEVDVDKLPSAIEALSTEVFGLKARADKTGAEALRVKYVESPEAKKRIADIAARWNRVGSVSFVYAIRL